AVLDAETGLFEWAIPEVFSEDFPSVLRFRATEDSANGLFATMDVRLIFIDPRAALAPGSASQEADYGRIPDPRGNAFGNSAEFVGGAPPRSFQPLGGAGGVSGLTPTRYLLFTGPGSGGTVSPQPEAVPGGSNEEKNEAAERPSQPARSTVPNAPAAPRRDGRIRQSTAGRDAAVRDEIPAAVAVDELLTQAVAQADEFELWVAASSAADHGDGGAESAGGPEAAESSDAAGQ
ncbi:MAG: hypothetical protein GYA33_03820, partial [Thermogutta sp.]|nr:hypothetical protein [Thermogutta sp.]